MSTDVHLIFPPQWSPFQPPLSTPSLTAWLSEKGYSSDTTDLNVAFYDYLFSDECADLLIESAFSSLSGPSRDALVSIFRNASDFRSSIEAFRSGHDLVLRHSYSAVKEFETYLKAVSESGAGFKISPYEFSFDQSVLKSSGIDAFCNSPPPIISRFVCDFIKKMAEESTPRSFGISCIGQEQLAFSALIGKKLKESFGKPVIIGGTILSRIYERGKLPSPWLKHYFDFIVRNEGEKPLEALLGEITAETPDFTNVPGIVYEDNDGRIVAQNPPKPLKDAEIPVPDFSELPLDRYFTNELTLPILSARGCYWGKCEFCHHGMVFGDAFSISSTEKLIDTFRQLTERYGVTSFAFNDEAIPPKTVRNLGKHLPDSSETNWLFTGLIKFEPFFTPEIFEDAFRVGFRALYVGLESASERVLELMRKNCTQETMLANLSSARNAGVWIHCFLFFGFPGETDDDAQVTYDFIMDNRDVIPSIGCGTFALEHNAPIFLHLHDFGVRVLESADDSIDVYYRYEVEGGLSSTDAEQWAQRLNDDSHNNTSYQATNWIPRELLLILLRNSSIDEVLTQAMELSYQGDLLRDSSLKCFLSFHWIDTDQCYIVNRLNRRVIRATKKTGEALQNLLSLNPKLENIEQIDDAIALLEPLRSEFGNKPTYLESSKVI